MGHDSVEPQRLCRLNGGDDVPQFAAGADALAGHSAVDLEVHRDGGAQGEALAVVWSQATCSTLQMTGVSCAG